ncbi:fibulin-2 isoform X1 [Conger conger]|uniref:fibulin-2 isoform X1 n=1 Tax=Conger conger TaxID=82655 RepID=UPI002A5A4E80|nr:fibulin-2 isoform X1 [Conger conger]XP_061076567.1 fibulin-2 isoform X1 [Conger conger]
MAFHKLMNSMIFILCIGGYHCQKDCTGVDCPVLDNCIEEVLETGACCASCLQTGCTCEGYQYYDCIHAGFRNGKVPEGESYFVDFGSTECSCPQAGGRISCHFIPCPEIPANCIDILEPADGCMQCERVGCVQDEQKYEAGHSFHLDPCQVCHCPNDGGSLMCYDVPECDPHAVQKPMLAATTEENSPDRHYNDPYIFDQDGTVNSISKPYRVSHSDTLPLFKQDPADVDEEEEYDYPPTGSVRDSLLDQNFPTEPAVVSFSYPGATVSQDIDRAEKQELRELVGTHEVETDAEEVTTDTPQTVEETTPTVQMEETTPSVQMEETTPTVQVEGTTPSVQMEETTTMLGRAPENQIHQQGVGDKEGKKQEDSKVVTSEAVTDTSTAEKGLQITTDSEDEEADNVPVNEDANNLGRRERQSGTHSQPHGKSQEPHTFPSVKFSPTSPPLVKMNAEEGQPPTRQPQTLFNYQTEEEEEEEEATEENNALESFPEHHEVSAQDLVENCCDAGQKWAATNDHCSDMPAVNEDRHSICRTAQMQCCAGFLKESMCLAGMNAARGGDACEAGDGHACGTDSFKECCDCCTLGMRFHAEGQSCEPHQYLGYPCSHIFVTCCLGDEGTSQPTIRGKERPKTTAFPQKVSDGKFPNEAFSIDDRDEAENSVEEPEDVDECQLHEGRLCHHRCINTWGSYECGCFAGYRLLQDGQICVPETQLEDNQVMEENPPTEAPKTPTPAAPTTPTPVQPDPCEAKGPCMHQCTAVEGQALCSCFPGYYLLADGHSCEDVNECRSGAHNCSRGDFCVNKEGSFQCLRLNDLCDEGFVHNVNRECVDVNECVTNTHSCQANESCLNTHGSFECERQITCPSGYQLRHGVCEDVDECLQRTHSCGVGFECQNSEGSFTCRPRQKCFTGFSPDAHGNCIDIDECSSLDEPCSSGFNCINTVGSYACQRKIIICSAGYHASPDGARCIDVDECQTAVHRCGEGQICHNLPGTYRCDCQTGYQYDMIRRVCVDLNECWRYPGRLCGQTCENTPGSYRCTCTSGFTLAYDAKNCEDVNECTNNPCSQECANVYGSYQCYCRQGFYLKEDGHTCEDIDECSQSIGNLCAFQCVNVPGSYQCACPPEGYSMSPNGRTCRDVDECAIGVHNCSAAETCYNIQGSYRCLSFACPPNYRRVSDTRCERISCPNFLDCQNTPLRITYYQLSFQTNIVIPAQIFRIGPSPAYSGDNIIISITRGNEENYFSTRKLNAFTGAVYMQRQVREPRDFLIDVEMKLLRQGTFTTFVARIYVFITAHSL